MVVGAFPKASETFIVTKFCGLLKRGLDVHLVCTQFSRRTLSTFSELDEDVLRRVHPVLSTAANPRALASSGVALLETLGRSPELVRGYFRREWQRSNLEAAKQWHANYAIARLRPALIHFEFGTFAPNKLYLKRALSARLVVSFRGYDLNSVGLSVPDYYSETFRTADCIHVLGNDLWQRAIRRGCPADKPHVVISPGIDLSLFPRPPAREASKRIRLLSVGRLQWKKGHEYSIQVVRKLLDHGFDCELRIIGEGAFRKALEVACWQLGVSDRVHLLGELAHSEVRAELSRADLMLHLAVSEGFCNAVLEAQAMQLPVVCSDADGLPENVQDGQTGLVVPRRSVDGTVEALRRLILDPHLRAKMGTAGRARVESQFSMAAKIDQFQRTYESLLSTEGQGGTA